MMPWAENREPYDNLRHHNQIRGSAGNFRGFQKRGVHLQICRRRGGRYSKAKT